MGVAIVLVGGAVFFLWGANMDSTCAANETASGCRGYLAFDAAIQSYTDIFRSVFARDCVGGTGPDSCIGPDLTIMAGTLFVLGFIGGGWLFRGAAAGARPVERQLPPDLGTKF